MARETIVQEGHFLDRLKGKFNILEDAMDAALVLITLVMVRLVLPFVVLMLFGTMINRRQVQPSG